MSTTRYSPAWRPGSWGARASVRHRGEGWRGAPSPLEGGTTPHDTQHRDPMHTTPEIRGALRLHPL
eukprot:1774874-Pyramimonas_sp.AAC.1